MNSEDGGTYRIELLAQDADPVFERLEAASDEEAVELARLRLLLGPEYQAINLWSEDRLIAALRRDSPRTDIQSVH